MMWKASSTLSINKLKMINLIKKLLGKKKEPHFAKCLNNRTWLDRQVDEALYKRDSLRGNFGRNLFTEKEASNILKPSDNWYDKYYENE
jgi:hypothetical protein